jgi:hypothetical protein
MSGTYRWNWRAMLPPAALLSVLLLAPGASANAQTAVKASEPTRVAEVSRSREVEITPEVACEAGSLHDCEQLYCRNGISEECRKHVLQTAKISADTWYLREQRAAKDNRATTYAIRCMTNSARPVRDLTITCLAKPGPNRCSTAPKSATAGYARLDKAAASYCSAS